jgi:glycosyltransferase involved in cell wall biosynthesis
MKIGLLITTFNRPEYLRQTLESLKRADLHGAQILIVDDCSRDNETLRLINPYKKIRNHKNLTIRYSVQIGFDYLIKQGCDTLINLDSDAIVRCDFLTRLLELYKQFPDRIISGFNTLSKSRTGIVRHPVIKQGSGFVEKASIGGINMLMSVNTYRSIVLPALLESQRTKDHWDKIACRMSNEQGKTIIVSSPSFIQHIGINSAMGHRDNPDVAQDFIPDYKEKLCIIQPHGLGDVIFCQTLVRSLGDSITWPVLPKFVSDLKRAYPDINWIADSESPVPLTTRLDTVINGFRALPIRYSDAITRVPYRHVMKAKYDMYGVDYKTWNDKAMWVRDTDKENSLFDLLGLVKGQYIVKNLTYMSDGSRRIHLNIEGIEVKEIPGYSLFDWAKVFENAKEIHTVSTSILYILDMLNTCPVYVYVRKPMEASHINYQYIFTDKKFIYRW